MDVKKSRCLAPGFSNLSRRVKKKKGRKGGRCWTNKGPQRQIKNKTLGVSDKSNEKLKVVLVGAASRKKRKGVGERMG